MSLVTVSLCLLQATPLATDPTERATFESEVLWITHAPREGAFGSTITPMGDLNGDGAADLMIGAPVGDFWTPRARGSVSFVDARTGRIFETYIQPKEYWRRGHGDIFPMGVHSLGDVNGDGFEDVALTVGNLSRFVDRTYLLSGRERAVVGELPNFVTLNVSSKRVSVGDVDENGIGEWIAHSTEAGRGLVMLSGLPGEVIAREPTLGEVNPPRWRFHYVSCLESIDDVSGDGVRDILVGGPSAQAPEAWFRVHSGKDLSFLHALRGSEDLYEAYAAEAVVAGDDVYLWTMDGGAATFHALSLNGRRGRAITTIENSNMPWRAKFAVVEDLDGDGQRDLLLPPPGSHSRRFRVISGGDGASLGETCEVPSIEGDASTRIGSFVFIGGLDDDSLTQIAVQVCAGEEDSADEKFGVCLLSLRP